MPLRIAFDLDDTLADLEGALLAFLTETERTAAGEGRDEATAPRRDEAPGSADGIAERAVESGALSDLTAKQMRSVWRAARAHEGFWETLPEAEPGVVRRIARLAEERGWDVVFITSRPPSAGAATEVQTERWLEQRGFPSPRVCLVSESRGRLAASLNLDVIVDDRPENCLDIVTESTAIAVLVWRGAEPPFARAARRLGIAVAGSVGECLDTLTALDPEAERDALRRRLRALFGVPAQPSAPPDVSPLQ